MYDILSSVKVSESFEINLVIFDNEKNQKQIEHDILNLSWRKGKGFMCSLSGASPCYGN